MSQTKTLLVFSLFVTLLILSACSGSPSIRVEPGEVDLGDIPAAQPVSATVQVRNGGSGTLEIAELRTSCGCTTAEIESQSLAAGVETTLTVAFDPLAHDGLYGPLLRIVYIQSNDPDEPELEIPVVVNVLTPEEVSQ